MVSEQIIISSLECEMQQLIKWSLYSDSPFEMHKI